MRIRDWSSVVCSSDLIYRLSALADKGLDVARLPYGLKVLLESLLRTEDGLDVTAEDIRGLASWDPAAQPSREISFTPARVILQDFTGVPAVVALAEMREAMQARGGDPFRITLLHPAAILFDHSVIFVDLAHNVTFRSHSEIKHNH